jgi:Flp pilus assembly protein TadB
MPRRLGQQWSGEKQTTAAGLFAAVKDGRKMTLINIIVILILVGLALWLVNTYIPMAGGIKSLLNVVVFVVVLIWLLQVFGLIGPVPIRIPPLK